MIKHRKWFYLLLVVTLVAVVGCGLGNAPTSTATPSKTANTVVKAQPVRIPFDDPPWWTNQAKHYTQFGFPVDLQVVPFTQLHDKVQTSLLGGACDYDVIHAHEGWTAEWATRGWLEPLEGRLDEATLADYPASAILKQVGPDGKTHTYTVGLYVWLNSFYWRTDIVKEEPPKTWDELIAMAAKYGTADTPGFIVALGASSSTVLYGTILRGEGGEILTNGKPSFNNAAGLKSLDTMIRLTKVLAPQSWAENSGSVTSQDFVAGTAVFAFAPPPTLVMAADPKQSKVVGKVAVGLVPGGSVNRSATYSENGGRAITACSTNKDRAWEYIQRVTSKYEMVYMSLALGRVPARISALNDPLVQSMYPLAKIVPEQLKYPAGMTVVHPRGTEISKVMADWLVKAMKGEVSAQEALNKAETDVKAITDAK